MTPAILDTDIFSEVLKSRNARVLERARAYRVDFAVFTISAITVMEIVAGLHKRAQAAAMAKFMDVVRASQVLDFDRDSAELAGKIHGDLERLGQSIGRADPMIAGTALHHGLVLVTANTAHFQRIRELGYPLELDNWRDDAERP